MSSLQASLQAVVNSLLAYNGEKFAAIDGEEFKLARTILHAILFHMQTHFRGFFVINGTNECTHGDMCGYRIAFSFVCNYLEVIGELAEINIAHSSGCRYRHNNAPEQGEPVTIFMNETGEEIIMKIFENINDFLVNNDNDDGKYVRFVDKYNIPRQAKLRSFNDDDVFNN